MFRHTVGLVTLFTIYADACYSDSTTTIAQNFLRPSIVKIVATYPNSTDDPGSCDSEGTGFIIDQTHVLTARHVITAPLDCGRPVILARSFYYVSEWHLNEVSSRGDASLLATDAGKSIEQPTNTDKIRPCAVGLSLENVYDTTNFKSTRYGIAKGQLEVTPVPVNIGSEHNEHQPLVKVTSSEFFHGESGGPVTHSMLVVGMLKDKLVNTNTMALMIPASELRSLLSESSIEFPFGFECSPIATSRGYMIKASVDPMPFSKGYMFTTAIGYPAGTEPTTRFKIALANAVVNTFNSSYNDDLTVESLYVTSDQRSLQLSAQIGKEKGSQVDANLLSSGIEAAIKEAVKSYIAAAYKSGER